MTAQREWFEKDYYKVLGVPKTSSAKEITKAYRKLAKQYHPDANTGDQKAEERFKEVSAAFDVLGDETKRKEYDEVRELSTSGMGGFGGFGGGAPGPDGPGASGSAGFGGIGDLGDLLGGLFGQRGGGAARGPLRGDDLEATARLSFLDAVNGTTTTVKLKSEASCPSCKGSGAKAGTNPTVCSQCRGSGTVNDNQGLFSFSRPCDVCHGSGRQIKNPCETCHGYGRVLRDRNVKVRIPAGVQDGARIRVPGRGAPGQNGGSPGDLFVLVNVEKDSTYGRKGKDLTIKLPVTYAELALGAEVQVPTLHGGVTMRIPRGTKAGKTLRLKEKGASGSDLLVTLELAGIEVDSPEERELLEKLDRILQEKKVRKKAES